MGVRHNGERRHFGKDPADFENIDDTFPEKDEVYGLTGMHSVRPKVSKIYRDHTKYMNDYKIIVLKSTVPVGTSRAVKNILEEKFEYHKDFDIISNPEFLREGKGLEDFLHPQRIIIGGDSEDTIKIIKKLYKPLLDKNIPLVETNIVSAQIIKYASNTFLATRVSFINEIANLCENIGANVNDVIQGMGYDRRIGHSYLKPGSGFGGPCLSKDLKALIKISEDSNYEPAFLKAILDKNEHQSQQIVKKIKESLDFPFYKKLITIYGLAFKEGTNDVRDSVSLRVIKQLLQEGIQIKAYDPKAITEAKRILPKIDYCYNPYEAVDCSELLVILTAWSEFRKLEYREIKNKMVSPKIFDVENILNSNELKSLGFIYKGIGNQ